MVYLNKIFRAIKRDEVLINAITWINPENIILSKPDTKEHINVYNPIHLKIQKL